MFLDKEYEPDEITARTTLAHIDPLTIEGIVAAWRNGDASGFVVKRKSGTFDYVTRRWNDGQTIVTYESYGSEPTHLYQRAVDWKRGDDLNNLNEILAAEPVVVLTDHAPGWRKFREKNLDERPRPTVIAHF